MIRLELGVLKQGAGDLVIEMTVVCWDQLYVCDKLVRGLISWLSGSGLNFARFGLFLIVGGSMR